jgi:hypothetical protein
MRILRREFLVYGLVLALACPLAARAADKKIVPWNQFVQDFLDQYFVHRPDQGVAAGRHEFDGRLPDWSREGIALMVYFLKQERTAAQKFNALNRAQEFERNYLLAQIDSDLFWIETAELPFTNPAYYTSFQGLDPHVYITRDYAPLDERMRAFTTYAQNVPRAVSQIRANLRTPMPRTFIEIGRIGFGGLASFLEKDVPKVFQSVQDTNLQTQFSAANKEAVTALKSLDKWLESELPRANNNFALGAARFQQMLWATERVKTPLPELERIGHADLDRNLAALKAACQKFAP